MKKQNSLLNQGIIIKKKKRKPIKNKKIKKAPIFNDLLKAGNHKPHNHKENYEYPHPHQYRNKNRDSLTIKRKKKRKKGLGEGLGWNDGTREKKKRKRKWKPNKAWEKREKNAKRKTYTYKYKRNKKQILKLGYQERLKLEHKPLLEYNKPILLPPPKTKVIDGVILKKSKFKSIINEKLKRSYRYYKGSITKRLNRLIETKMLDKETKQRITRIINDIFVSVKYMIDNGFPSLEYLECIREKLKDIIRFLRKLEECNWSLGSYVRNNGFHEIFAPMSEFETTGSLKTIEAVNKFSDYLKQCDIYIKTK